MPSLEVEYFLRLARVGSVVLALSVGGFYVLRGHRQAAPPPPVDEGIPLILLENATISESPEEIERAPDFVGSTNPVADETRDVLEGQPLVAPTVHVDLPAAPPLSAEPLLAPGSPLFTTPATSISSAKSSLLESSSTEVGTPEAEKKKPSGRKP